MDDLILETELYANDNWVRVYGVDGKLDEVHVSDALGQDWLIIGYKDLMKVLKKAENKYKKMKNE